MISEAQRIERRQGIGGSDAAAVLGLSPWSTPVTVWLDKTGRAEPKPESPAMRYGSYFEDYVAKLYAEETGSRVENYRTMIHKGCLLGNLDRLVVPEGAKIASHKGEIRTNKILECKTSGRDWNGELPIHVYTQTMHYIGLNERLESADVGVLYRHSLKFEIFNVERDDVVIGVMQERLNAWWEEYVIGDKMPPPTNEADCKLLWVRSNPGKTVTASKEVEEKLKQYNKLKADEKSAKEAAEIYKNDICAFLEDNEVLLGIDGKPILTWKSPNKEKSDTDWEALARSLGATDEQIAKFTTFSIGGRRFLPKNAKAK